MTSSTQCTGQCCSPFFLKCCQLFYLELTVQTRVVFNTQRSVCLCLQSARIKCVCHHTQKNLLVFFLVIPERQNCCLCGLDKATLMSFLLFSVTLLTTGSSAYYSNCTKRSLAPWQVRNLWIENELMPHFSVEFGSCIVL